MPDDILKQERWDPERARQIESEKNRERIQHNHDPERERQIEREKERERNRG